MNKKLIILLISLIILSFSVVANADNAAYVEEGTSGCIAVWDTCAADSVYYKNVSNHGGITNLTCDFEVSEECTPEKKAFKMSGFTCYTYMGETDNSFLVVDTEGYAHLRCQIKR